MGIFSNVVVGIGANIASESLLKLLEGFNDKKAINDFLTQVSSLLTEFEHRYDGTIMTSSAFISSLQKNNVIDSVIAYVIKPFDIDQPERPFLADMQEKMIGSIQSATGYSLSVCDRKIVHDFLFSVFDSAKSFLLKITFPEDKALLYAISQAYAKVDEISKTIAERFKLTETAIASIQKQLEALTETANETEDIPSLIRSWNDRQIINLGNRYLPEINVSVQLSDVLHGAAVSTSFRDNFIQNFDKFIIAMRRVSIPAIKEYCKEIIGIVNDLELFDISPQDLAGIINILDNMKAVLSESIDQSRENLAQGDDINHHSRINELNRCYVQIVDFQKHLNSDAVRAATVPYILLVGDGGSGKSHLIADFVSTQGQHGQLEFLLLGQNFSSGTDVMSEFPRLIGSTHTYHELLQQMESIAHQQQSRVLICVDALNEGAGVSLWKTIVPGWIELLKGYPHIGLLLSVRTQYEEIFLDGQTRLKEQLIRIEHTGFGRLAYEAMHRYFSFYEITTDSVSILNSEFYNPLFLQLFCETNRGKHCEIGDFSLPELFSGYINTMEKRIAEKCGYNASCELIREIINKMVSVRSDDHDGTVMLSVLDVMRIVIACRNEWGVNSDVYSALLSEGILTQDVNYDGQEYVHVTYERIEDYFLAERIVAAYAEITPDDFLQSYSWVLYRQDLLEMLGIILAEQKGLELYEVFQPADGWISDALRSAFLYGLLWRSKDSISKKTITYINSNVLESEDGFNQFIDILFSLATRVDHPLNSDRAFHFFAQYKLPDRDATFMDEFNLLYANSGSALYRLVDWGLHYSQIQTYDDITAELAGTALCWLLLSSNNTLRDKATKAITNLLLHHIDALIQILKRFKDIDDPYILERLYAAAFGCVVQDNSKEKIGQLAQFVYDSIFDQECVYPNILLRTYAKDIVDYAIHLDCIKLEDEARSKITPPYKSIFPKIPSDEEIVQYDLVRNQDNPKDFYYSKSAILRSMEVERDREGHVNGYGNFGRYTFQSYFSNWPQLHPMDLKNIAIKRIFDLGYNSKLHGVYDRHRTSPFSNGLETGRVERIGKKYQWIALYELAAQVSDNYKMRVYECNWDKPTERYCGGSYEPNIRNIDPTILVNQDKKEPYNWINYIVPDVTYEKWVEDFNAVPTFEQCAELQYAGNQFLLLKGDYTWREEKKFGYQAYELPCKVLWRQINAYIVKKDYVDNLQQALNGVDFMGRWMPECHSRYEMYNKEFYWSDAYNFFRNPYYGGDDWESIDYENLKAHFSDKVLIPVIRYDSERNGDLNAADRFDNAFGWYKPCGALFNGMKMQYRDGNSLCFDSDGNLICFDSSELFGTDAGLFIEKKRLGDFLQTLGYSLIWTSLQEKEIISSSMRNEGLPLKRIHLSEVYWLNHGQIQKVSETSTEEPLYYC